MWVKEESKCQPEIKNPGLRINIKKQNKTKQKQKQTNKKKPSIMTVGLINS